MTLIVWLDLETTGLSPRRDDILEVSAGIGVLEDPFNCSFPINEVIGFGYDIRQAWLDDVDPVVREMHAKSGLLKEVLRSETRLDDVEQDLMDLIPDVADRDQKPILAGSSVHFDLAFLREHMPAVAGRFSHRLYDVSAIKLFCQSLGMPKLPKAEAHRALDDVKESIAHAKACAEWVQGHRLMMNKEVTP